MASSNFLLNIQTSCDLVDILCVMFLNIPAAGSRSNATNKKSGATSLAFLFVLGKTSKLAHAVFEDNLLQAVDRRIRLECFASEGVTVGVGNVTAVAISRHEGIVQNEFFAVRASGRAHDAGFNVIADDAVIDLWRFEEGYLGHGVQGDGKGGTIPPSLDDITTLDAVENDLFVVKRD
jgi:hypothetical protein